MKALGHGGDVAVGWGHSEQRKRIAAFINVPVEEVHEANCTLGFVTNVLINLGAIVNRALTPPANLLELQGLSV